MQAIDPNKPQAAVTDPASPAVAASKPMTPAKPTTLSGAPLNGGLWSNLPKDATAPPTLDGAQLNGGVWAGLKPSAPSGASGAPSIGGVPATGGLWNTVASGQSIPSVVPPAPATLPLAPTPTASAPDGPQAGALPIAPPIAPGSGNAAQSAQDAQRGLSGAPPAPSAALPLGNLAPRPVTTQDNWRTADASLADWQQQHDTAAANHIASLGPIAGDDGTLSQDTYSKAIGKVQAPSGAWVWPEDLAADQAQAPKGPSVYNSENGTLLTQSLNGGPLTTPTGAPASSPFEGGINNAPTPQQAAAQSLPLAPSAPTTGAATPNVAPSSLPIAPPNTSIAAVDPTAYANLTNSGDANYLNQTITPGPGVDRLALAQSNFDNFAKASDPAYEKALRDATSAAAGAGRLGSGMLRTSYGDLANQRALQLDTQKQSLLNDATSGSIDDAYKNIGIAQQQQGFQAGQQNTQFNQAATQTQIEEALRNGDVNRAIQLLSVGEQGNPASTGLGVSGIASGLSNSYGNQATQAGAGAASVLQNALAGQGQQQNTAAILQALGLSPQGINGSNSNAATGLTLEQLQQLLGGSTDGGYGPPIGSLTPPISQTPLPLGPVDTGYTGSIYQPPNPYSLPLASSGY